MADTPNLDLLIERASWYPPLDRDAVLREVERLRAENARLREALIVCKEAVTRRTGECDATYLTLAEFKVETICRAALSERGEG